MEAGETGERPRSAVEVAAAATLLVDVVGSTRLSGGASRETWLLDLAGGQQVVLQRRRAGASDLAGGVDIEARLLAAASEAGVPVPELVASGPDDGFGGPWTICRFVDGEAAPRRILDAPELSGARSSLVARCGSVLADVHRIDPTVFDGSGSATTAVSDDPVSSLRSVLDGTSGDHPVLELALRRLELTRPRPRPSVVVHGDFRLGNLLVDGGGLAAVLDWELAHLGDPAEDLGWCCVRAWRFGGAGRALGLGSADELLDAYRAAGGVDVSADELAWWELYGTVRWGVICAVQAEAHLSGSVRSVELAAIGRRATETEYDALRLLGVDVPSVPADVPADARPVDDFGRPSAIELLDAVRGFLDDDVRRSTSGRTRFHAIVAARVLDVVARELAAGSGPSERRDRVLAWAGVSSEREWALAVRAGRFDERWAEAGDRWAVVVADRLAVANPAYPE